MLVEHIDAKQTWSFELMIQVYHEQNFVHFYWNILYYSVLSQTCIIMSNVCITVFVILQVSPYLDILTVE